MRLLWLHSRPGRLLTSGERRLVASIFGHAIDLRPVRLHRRRWWPLQPRDVVMAPDGHLWFHPEGSLWRDDFSAADLGLRGLFIHEMTHIWQHQQGIFLPLSRHPFCRYAYRLRPNKAFTAYGLEQQAEIVRHAYLAWQGMVAPQGTLALYEALLPFRPLPSHVPA